MLGEAAHDDAPREAGRPPIERDDHACELRTLDALRLATETAEPIVLRPQLRILGLQTLELRRRLGFRVRIRRVELIELHWFASSGPPTGRGLRP